VDGGEYFNAVLYTGNAADRSITGVGFAPDWVWIKNRSAAFRHGLFDVVRGANKRLSSSSTQAETTFTESLTSFDSDGFSLGDNSDGNNTVNINGDTYVAWNWKANGAGVSNTDGSITSTVSANTTAGFSVVTYTGNGSSGATVGHGLGVVPNMVIVKQRSGANDWWVKHSSLASNLMLILNSTSATYNGTVGGGGGIGNLTSSTTFGFVQGATDVSNVNGNGATFVAYCFAPVAGYSAFGSYTGNGSSTDGPFVYFGFRPAFVITKRIDSGDNWIMSDSKRGSFNFIDEFLNPNTSNAESNNNITTGIDYLSNGFKLRSADGSVNASGGTYIFMAFAENPFKYALAR
jgi:hypothetical protein